MFSHYIYESQCSGNIVLIIFPRLFNRFSYCFQPCKMNTGINILFFKNICQCFSVKNICLVEFYWFASNFFYSFQTLLTGIAQVIQNHYIISCVLKLNNCMASDITGASCN